MTDYIILECQTRTADSEETWGYRGHSEARSATSAIRSHLDGTETSGIFVALPARSWKPVNVKVETKTALKFS
jgi:hypothetical protein